MTQCLDSKKAHKDEKLVFLKETAENANLHKAVLNKITTREQCEKYDFVAPLKLTELSVGSYNNSF